MTATQHFTSASSWSVPAGITKARAVAAGECGLPYTLSGRTNNGGPGAVVSGIIPVSGSLTVGVGSIAGGDAGYSGAGKGGRGTVVGSVVGAGGGGGGQALNSDDLGYTGGAGGKPGEPGGAGGEQTAGAGRGGKGGGADGTGGAGGTAVAGTAGTAGQSHDSGGAGGKGGAYSSAGGGGGGGGLAGGGGGGIDMFAAGYYDGAGGGGGSSSGDTFVGFNSGAPYADLFWASTPLVPTLLGPVGNGVVDRTQPIPLTLSHNGATTDVLDAQTDADVRHRKVGAGSWATVSSLGTATSTAIAANTYADGDQVEWQARTYADGQQGPWSDSALFTAKTPPDTPVITTPAGSSTIGTASIVIAWTHDGQVQYQARVVSDNSGTAGTLVYADSGAVTSAALTTTLTVKVNEVDAHVQVRARDVPGGLWSQWADVLVSISWEPPPVARVTRAIDEKRGSIVIAIVNPTPEGVQPDASVNRVFITEGGVEQAPVLVAPSTTWTYWTPVGDVAVRVEAVDESTGVLSSTGVIW